MSAHSLETVRGTAPSQLFTGRLARHLGEGFRRERLSRGVVLADVGREATDALMSWGDLNAVLATRPLTAPQLRLFRQGRQVPVHVYAHVGGEGALRPQTLRQEDLYRQLREGASLILDSVNALHSPVAEAALDLTRFVHEPVQASLYAVWGGARGFDTHWDDNDTFVVQLAGSKSWAVHGPGLPHPLAHELTPINACPDAVLWEGTLRPGHILHVPRGWWHTVRGTGDGSLHLTFGFARRTGLDWLGWVLERLREAAVFRADLPRFAHSEDLRAHASTLRDRLVAALDDHDVEAFLAHRDAAAPRRYRFCLPHPLSREHPSDDVTVTFTPVLSRLCESEGRVELTADRRRFTFRHTLGPLLRALATEESLRCGELRGRSGLDRQTFAAALEVLLEQHLITVTPPARPDPGWTPVRGAVSGR